MTRDGFERVVRLLEGAFRATLDEKSRDAYWMLWIDQDDTALLNAAAAYARNPERARYGFPKPGDLLESQAVDLEAQAECALQLVMANNDPRESVNFEDRAIHAAIERMGGWAHTCRAIRELPERDFGFWARDFKTAYRAARASGVFSAPERFIGAYEENNAERWPQHVPATRRIGCPYLPQLPEGEPVRLLTQGPGALK